MMNEHLTICLRTRTTCGVFVIYCKSSHSHGRDLIKSIFVAFVCNVHLQLTRTMKTTISLGGGMVVHLVVYPV